MKLVKSFLSIITILTIACITAPAASAASYAVTNTNDSGTGSLRQAITSANSDTALDTITFTIGSGAAHITLSSPLPPVVQPTIIDGTTQPGYSGKPLIELSGNTAGLGARGFYISGNGAGSIIKGLVINRFSAQGVFIDTGNVTIKSNYIGTDAAGQSSAGNGGDGVAIFSGTSIASSNNNVIGGNGVGDGNLISGNQGNGIGITAQAGGTADGNSILGNYVGVNVSGNKSIANLGDGVLINHSDGGGPASAKNTIIGGTTGTTPNGSCTGACNLISGNGVNGIGLWHGGVTGTKTFGNYVGTDLSGTIAIPNGDIGIEINETANNTTGNATSQGRNIFSGNGGAGVFLTGAGATGNTIQGNYVGTNVTGMAAIPNLKMGLGIGYSPGIQSAHDNIIGSTLNKSSGICDGGCNLISGNVANGILMSLTSGNKIVANHIGVNQNNTQSIGNGADGIGYIGSPNNAVGSEVPNEGNIIAGNGNNGIIIIDARSTGNRIVGNSITGNVGAGVLIIDGIDNAILQNQIYSNSRLGIDLGNNSVSLNDLGDGDTGPNHYQNFPDIYAIHSNVSSYISGTLNSQPNTSYRIDFFQSDGCNAGKPNNYGQGQGYIGNIILTTDQYGNKVFTYTSPQILAGNKYITSTATKMIGSTPAETSEFSLCRLVNTTRPGLTNGATWSLKDDLTTGVADKSFGYGFPSYLLMCAWDQNQKGVKLPVVVNGNTWYMRASYTTGTADQTVQYGFPGAVPVCGDWDGDGIETIGIFNGGNWYLRNSNTSGAADITFSYGASNGTPVIGDWSASGHSGVGVVTRTDSLIWDLRNTLSSGPSDYHFSYGGNTSTPIVGDWDGNGSSDIGSYSSGVWNIRNTLTNGLPTGTFSFGSSNYYPVGW